MLSLLLLLIAGPVDDPPCCQKELRPSTAFYAVALNTAVPALVGGLLIAADDNSQTGQMLALYAWSVGPSGGQIYTRDWLRGGIGTVLRAGGGLLIGYGIAEATDDGGGPHLSDRTIGLMVWGGLALTAAATIWNVATIPGSVRRANQMRSLRFEPTVGPGGSVGIGLRGRF